MSKVKLDMFFIIACEASSPNISLNDRLLLFSIKLSISLAKISLLFIFLAE